MKGVDLSSHKTYQSCIEKFSDILVRKAIHKAMRIELSENCTGNYIYQCKNVRDSYDIIGSEDCRYCYDAMGMKDCYDAYEPAFDCELQYDSHGCNGGKRLLACHICYDNDTLAYSDFCHNSSHLFGCIGLRRKQYCILNKQYTKDEYESLVPKIIEHMRNDGGGAMNPSGASGSWGEFFPVTSSPFPYNETTANEYYPLTEQESKACGWKWVTRAEEAPKVAKTIPAARLPDSTTDIPDDVLSWAIECEVTKRPYKIIKQELDFYRTMRVPIPRLHPDERHRRRMMRQNPRKLWNRVCAKCQKPIVTSFAPERPEVVYCESCYLTSVY